MFIGSACEDGVTSRPANVDRQILIGAYIRDL